MSVRRWNPAKWACVLLVIVVVLAAFGVLAPRAAGVSEPGVPKAFPPSTLRVGGLQEPDSLNPHVGVLTASYNVWAHVYELLVGIGEDLTPVPALAASWYRASDTVWIFNLTQGVTWHDGQPFTADDVNFTFRYIWPQTAWNPIGCDLTLLQGYLGDPTRNIGVDVNNITVLSSTQIRIPTYQPKANIRSMFIQILPEHVWSAIPCNQAGHVKNVPPIGTGMYKFTTWVRGTYIQLDLYTDYWRLDKSGNTDYVDTILITYYTDATLLFNAFVAGSIDATSELPVDKFNLIPSIVGGASVANVRKYRQDAISVSEVGACVASDTLISDNGKRGGRNWLLTNLTVRQALQHSVDRQSLVDNVIFGAGKPGSTLIPPATPLWHYNVTAAENYSFNLDRARQLLNDPKGDGYDLRAGQTTPGLYGENIDPARPNNQDAFIDTDGDQVREVVNSGQVVAGDQWGPSAPNNNELRFTLSVINYNDEGKVAALLMIDWWSQVGIAVTRDIVTESRMITITYDCSVDLYIWGWGGDVDPDFLLSVMTTEQILYWQDAWYSNSTYDTLYRVQQQQLDLAQRQQTIWQMQRILYHDAAYLIMYYPFTLTVVRTDKFTGWGDWEAHLGLGLTGFGNDFAMLTLRPGGAVTNQCPTTPVIEGTPPIHVYVNVSGRFTANASDPEDDALTWFFSWDDGNRTQVNTGAGVTQANASWAWERTGTYAVTVTVDDGKCGGFRTSAPFNVIVDPLPAQFGWLNGTVEDAGTSAKIVGATVSATAGGGVVFSTTTDSTGLYNLTLALGTYAVTASQALYASSTQTGIAITENTTRYLNFALTTVRGWIVGTVTSSAGGTLTGATIQVSGARPYSTQTDAQGRYNVTVAPGTFAVTASRDGYQNATQTGIAVADKQERVVDFVLTPVPGGGLDALTVALIGLAVVVAIAGLAAWLILRRRKKEEEITTTPLPPPPPKPPQNP